MKGHRSSAGCLYATALLVAAGQLAVAFNLSGAKAYGGTTDSNDDRRVFDEPTRAQRDSAFSRLSTIAKAKGAVPVIVQFAVPGIDNLARLSREKRRHDASRRADAQLAGAIDRVVSIERANLTGVDHTFTRSFRSIPFLALTASEAALEVLRKSPRVIGITEDLLAAPMLDSTTELIGATTAWSRRFDGTGWYVAVLDSGILASHEFFAGKNIVQACFARGDDQNPASGGDCPNGLASDVFSPDAARQHTAVTYDHGTRVAGIVAGNNSGSATPSFGVAREANLIAIQVFSLVPSANNGVLAWNTDVIAAMDYVYSLRRDFNVAAVNISLGGNVFADEATCDMDVSGMKAIIDNLRAVEIATVIGSGNNGSCSGITWPGCISSAITVGSTGDLDNEALSSNFHPTMLELYAPGVGINSSCGFSDTCYGSASGTSFATPHVAGAWAILKQANPAASVQQILDVLQDTGQPVSGRCEATPSQHRIQIDAALDVLAPLGSHQSIDSNGEAVPAGVDLSDGAPNAAAADDFVSDGGTIAKVRWWGTDGRPVPVPNPPFTADFQLDDGSSERSIGVNSAANGFPFGWANRFRNTSGSPIQVASIEVAFGAPGGSTGVSVGDAVDAVIWIDSAATGNMLNATKTLQWALPGGVHPGNGSLALHDLPGGGVTIPAGADFYVGLGSVQSQIDGVRRFPAALDTNSSAGQSWMFWGPSTFNADNLAGQTLGTVDNLVPPGGNWLIRAYVEGPGPAVDGWLISLHEPLDETSGSVPPLGQYFCGVDVVVDLNMPYATCDASAVHEYLADLSDCCLLAAGTDSRSGLVPAQVGAFDGELCAGYSISIQAVVGTTYGDPSGPNPCDSISTGMQADDSFWWWHSTERGANSAAGLEGALESIVPQGIDGYVYGPWDALAVSCSENNMAFELLAAPGSEGVGGADCNDNAEPDSCELDTDSDGVPDDCDQCPGGNDNIDNNGNGIPDDCEANAPLLAALPHDAQKNRYISFDPNNSATPVAFEVTLSDGRICWVGEPCLRSDTNGVDPQWVAECVQSAAGDGSDMVRDWSSYTDPATGDPVVHVRGCVILPNETYDVRAMAVGGTVTAPLAIGTVPAPTLNGSWADCVGDFVGGSWTPPDSNTSFKDISAGVQGFQQAQTAPVTWIDMVPGGADEANYILNFADIGAIIQGFQNVPYAGTVATCGIPVTRTDCP